MWGQANAEPLPLTQALMAQRHAIGHFDVFLGITYSDTLKPNTPTASASPATPAAAATARSQKPASSTSCPATIRTCAI